MKSIHFADNNIIYKDENSHLKRKRTLKHFLTATTWELRWKMSAKTSLVSLDFGPLAERHELNEAWDWLRQSVHYIRQLRGWREKLVEPPLPLQLSSAYYFDPFKSWEFNAAKFILIQSSQILHSSVLRERNRNVSYT